MSNRLRFAIVGGAAATLVAFATLLGGPGEDVGPKARITGLPGPSRAELEQAASTLVREGELREDAAAARAEAPEAELGPRPRDVAAVAEVKAEAGPVARRFFSAFARYELGETSRRVSEALEATSTPAFARQLLAAPPRLTAGAEPPPRARLSKLELVPGDADLGKIATAEVVGDVSRGEVREPLAIELVREGGGWLVSELGR